MTRLILVLGDQLSDDLPALRAADPAADLVVMAEVMEEGTYVPHHPQKIALILAAMRKFARRLQERGFRVAYSRLDDPDTGPSIGAELLRRAAETGAREAVATRPGDWRLIEALEAMPLPVRFLPDDRFLCPADEFARWTEGRKQLRMEWFYREMRRRTGLLMEGDEPAGGKWNFDTENRKPAAPDLLRPRPLRFEPDARCARYSTSSRRAFRAISGGSARSTGPPTGPRRFGRSITSSAKACRASATSRMRCSPTIRS